MPSDRLYELLAQAKARPSGAYRALEAALGAVNDVGEGYMKGQEIQEAARKKRFLQQSLMEAMGGQVPEELSGLGRQSVEAATQLAPFYTAAANLRKSDRETKEKPTMIPVSPALNKITGLPVGSMVNIDKVNDFLVPKERNPLDDEFRRLRNEELKRKQGSDKSISTAFNFYTEAKKGLESALKKTATGPIVGRLPAYTASQQSADAAVASMAPVLKQLFRVAGEGVFTDRDQALLMGMVTDRTIRPEARPGVLKNVDNIIRAKLGMAPDSGKKTYQKTATNAQGVRIGTNDNWKTFEPVQE